MATLDADDRLYLEALLEPMKQTLKRHEKALFGNGQMGLMERMTQRDGTLGLHASRISAIEANSHSHGARDRLTNSGLSTVVAAVVAGIVAALRPQ
jgi:hypothetical protein